MPSPVNTVAPATRLRRAADVLELWNRKLHFYIGLFLLFFVWLFAFTGMLLNHPKWTFDEFYPQRKQSAFERPIQPPPPGPDLAQARSILDQLGMTGEIEWTSARTDSRRLDFRVTRPGQVIDIKADLDGGRAAVQRVDYNAWGVMRIMHSFTGARAGDARNQRDWIVTTLWALSMDTLAAGLLIMTFGSYYMWWRLPRKRAGGLIALVLGWGACALFAVGLRLWTA